MKLRLMVKTPETGMGDEITVFEWKGSICVIGRKNCEMVVEDPYCSHRHALLYQGSRGELRVRDLGSTNGTYVRGRRVADAELHLGDELRVGHQRLSVFDFRPDRGSSREPVRDTAEFSVDDNGTHVTATRRWAPSHPAMARRPDGRPAARTRG